MRSKIVAVAAACTLVFGITLGFIVYFSIRISVPERHCAILMRKTGLEISNDQEISPLPKNGVYYRGVQQEVLREGRYFYNPYYWSWKIIPMYEVPANSLAVKVRRFGDDIPYGEVIAWKENQKGIVPEVLRPGRYSINPHMYDVELFKPVTVPAGFRGVRTLLSSPMPDDPNVLLVESGKRGVQKDTYEEGTYYVNPYVERVSLVDCRSQRFNLSDETNMGFPSKDGFWVTIDGRIEFRINPEEAALVFVTYNDVRNKKAMSDPVDEEIIHKVIMPNARSFCRLRGSDNSGRDFIGGETRKAFQEDFSNAMMKACAPNGIEIIQALVTRVTPPQAIAGPVRDREVAVQQLDQYTQQTLQQVAEKDLAIQKELIKRGPALREAEQEVVKVTEKSNEKQKVALQHANREYEVALLDLEAAKDKAAAVLARGKAAAEVIRFQNEAEAAGWKEGVLAFQGDGLKYARSIILKKLAPGYDDIMVNTADSPLMDIFKEYSKQE